MFLSYYYHYVYVNVIKYVVASDKEDPRKIKRIGGLCDGEKFTVDVEKAQKLIEDGEASFHVKIDGEPIKIVVSDDEDPYLTPEKDGVELFDCSSVTCFLKSIGLVIVSGALAYLQSVGIFLENMI